MRDGSVWVAGADDTREDVLVSVLSGSRTLGRCAMEVSGVSEDWTDDRVVVERGFAGLVRGQHVRIHQAAAGPVLAGGDVELQYAGCGPMAVGGNVSIMNGGCGPVLAAGDVSIERGGAQSMVSLGKATLGPGSFVGAVLSPSATIEDGAKVLMTLPQAVAFGAAAGAVFALLGRRRSG
jgi:hypothetical protein